MPLSCTIPGYAIARNYPVVATSYFSRIKSQTASAVLWGGGVLICASLGPVWSASTYIFLLLGPCHCFCSCHASLLAVHTCCNLHAENVGGCSLEASMEKEPSEKVGLVMGRCFESDVRHPWQDGQNLLTGFLTNSETYMKSDRWLFSFVNCSPLISSPFFPNSILRKSLLILRACAIMLSHRLYQPSRRSDDLR